MAASHLIFLGTYTRSTSKGIYALRLDGETGALSAPILAAEATSPAWIALSPDRRFLYAIHESQAQAIGFSVDARNARLTPLPAATSPAASAPSHLAVDATGRVLLAANYRDGYVSALPIRGDGTLGAPNKISHTGSGPHPTRQEKPHVHSVTVSPDNRFVIVADLGVDKIFSYALDPAKALLAPAEVPFVAAEPGAGPRHFKFGADGRQAYAINELANTITAFDYDPRRGALTPRQSVPTLPADFQGASTTAEVRVHPNGKFVYGSNRGHDSIAVFAVARATGLLSPVQTISSGGKTPRNFALSPDGRWLICGHQDSDELTVFSVDPATGRLQPTPHRAKVPMCVCVLFYD
ncbi:MAG TPA: lactonase family protein [Opitutaceae bacterium]|nr:lactonase family protein [Opitutaceae bacterium]